MKEGDHVELIVDGGWFKRFPWSRQLIDPDTRLAVGASAIPIYGSLLDLKHPYGVIVQTDGTWDAKGNKHGGLEAFIPWSQVIGILKIGAESEPASKSFGFKPQRKH